MTWQIAAATAQGGRAEQQDRIAVFSDGGDRHLLVLADGMGGHQGGAMAAQIVIDTAKTFWEQKPSELKQSTVFLQELCSEAHDRVFDAGQELGQRPHSTCIILYLDNNAASWAHIGDSRLYQFSGSKLVKRSLDHSVVQIMLQLGEITEDEMATHPDQNQLLRSLGGRKKPQAEVDQVVVGTDGGFLLCSDGLWETVSVGEMSDCLLAKELAVAANNLVGLAAKRGGANGDNVSVVVAKRAKKRGLMARMGLYFMKTKKE